MEYGYYEETYKGTLTEEEFDKFIGVAEDIILCYIHDLASIQYESEPLEFFGDFNRALCYEVDLLNSEGMEAFMNEPTASKISSVNTSGFSFRYSTRNSANFYVKGLPFHPMSRDLVDHELRKNGFTNRVIAL